MKIFLSAGHGASDPGAIGNGYKEADLTRKITLAQEKALKAKGHDVVVRNVNTNEFDEALNLNFKGYDLVISNHINSASNEQATGVETYYSTSYPANSQTIAKGVNDALASAYYIANRSVKSEDWRIIYLAGKQGVDALLIEHGFIVNADDMHAVLNNIDKAAEALASAISSDSIPSEPSFQLPEQPQVSEPTPQPTGVDTITLPKENAAWRIYNENGPYTTNHAIGALNPQKFGGLTYDVVRWVAKGEVAIINSADFGRVGIYVAKSTGAIIKYAIAEQAPQQKKTYIKLGAENETWRVYNVNGPYTSGKEVGKLAPAQFGGLEYEVVRWIKTNEIAVINTQSFGQVAIYVASVTGAKIVTK
ncbi:MAG: N-acetylmuramoyl-L-alanine amidase [Culicoidibacterales bacterium]